MRRGNGEPGTVGEGLEQGGCQGGSLTWIRAGPHLVQQHQGRGRTSGQSRKDATDALHMTAEGRQALLQGLLIADIRQNLRTPGKRRLTGAGQQHPGPCHQRSQTDAFKGDCFSTGVRSGDRHHPQPG